MKLDRILQAGIAVTLCLFVFVLYRSLHENAVKAGDQAPDFSIRTDDGKTVTEHNFGGKLLLVNFWASWCAPCIDEFPALNEMTRKLAPKGLVVLGISQDADENAYKRFLAKNPAAFLTARDPSKDIQLNYGTQLIPESYLIDRNGKVLEKFVSSMNWASPRMIEHVQSLL